MTIDEITAIAILVALFLVVVMMAIFVASTQKIEHKEQYRRYEENYHNRFKTIDLPRDYYYVSVLGQSDDARNQFDFTDYLAWREDDMLCFFPERVWRDEYFQSDFYALDDLTLALSRIKVEAINSFRIQLDGIEKNGKVSEEFTIEAGLIRGMVASDLLDLFGNEIYIDTLDYEARKCTLFYFDEDGQKQRVVFAGNDAEVLNLLLPEKKIEFYEAFSMKEFEKENDDVIEIHIPDMIREYAKLRDEGLISAEEFEQKKQQLLGLSEASDVNEE